MTATLILTADRSSAFLHRYSDGLDLGAGADQHLPVADSWSGHAERSCIGFPVKSSTWDPMGAIVTIEVELTTTGSGGVHVGVGSSPSMSIRRITEGWKPNGSSMDTGNATTDPDTYPGPATTSTDAKTASYSGTAGESSFWTDITRIGLVWAPTRLGGKGATCQGVALIQLDGGANIAEVWSAKGPSGKRPRLRITYKTLAEVATSAPTLVSPVGEGVNASRYKLTSAKTFASYDLQVSTDHTFATVSSWNVVAGVAGIAGKAVDVAYAGTPYLADTAYYWRARTTDANGPSSWSSPASFLPDAGASPMDPTDAWAGTVLSELSTPRKHTGLRTLIPHDDEVAELATTPFGGRWHVLDANHGTPIDRVVEVVGLSIHASDAEGWIVSAVTHDLGGAELVPLDLDE